MSLSAGLLFMLHCTVTTPDLHAVTTMLPLFPDKADTPAIIKHSMTILQSLTQHLNPGQIPVIAPFLPKLSICNGHGQVLMEKTNLSSCLEVFTWRCQCGTC